MTRVGRGGHSAETRAEVLEALKATGLPIRDVAECFGVSTGAVWNWMRAAGHTPRPYQRNPDGIRNRAIPAHPLCHPERPFYALKMCRQCYRRAYQPKVAA